MANRDALKTQPYEGFAPDAHFLNPMVTAAKPLLGLGMHLQTLSEVSDIPGVYHDVHRQLAGALAQLQPQHYEPAHLLACSYTLCLYLDEAVMGTPWGRQSVWSQRSLLSEFHQETWGGEKFFTIVSHMMLEPQRYLHGLELMYLCLCIGLRGKYAIDPKGQDTLNALIKQLHGLLCPLRPSPPPLAGVPCAAAAVPRLKSRWQWWTPLAASAMVLMTMYGYFSLRLYFQTEDVLLSLQRLLR